MTPPSRIRGSCHCGSVEIVLTGFPDTVTECNCSLCRRYGVLWAYVEAEAVVALPDGALTDRYAWNGRHVDFHRCKQCGCVTHWMPRDARRAAQRARTQRPAVRSRPGGAGGPGPPGRREQVSRRSSRTRRARFSGRAPDRIRPAGLRE